MFRIVIIGISFWASMTASAQGFTVYTTVRAAVDGEVSGPVLSRSNTILHAGRSYDHMEEVGELVICDPTKRRITLIHKGELGTRLAFEELAQYVNVGRNETEKYAREITNTPGGVEVSEALKFQLLPAFEKKLIENRLSLTGTHWRYDVDLAQEVSPGYADRYADYADIAARLNFVLHPGAFFPAVRERLNDELRNHDRIATRVSLTADLGDRIELVAEHRYRWSLENIDRRQVNKFDDLAASDDIEWVSFREYQTRLLRSF